MTARSNPEIRIWSFKATILPAIRCLASPPASRHLQRTGGPTAGRARNQRDYVSARCQPMLPTWRFITIRPHLFVRLIQLALSGLGYTFPQGTVITNKQFVVIARNRAVFASTYGSSIPVLVEFDGNLDPRAKSSPSSKPVQLPIRISHRCVRYEAAAPWPAAANAGGTALQLTRCFPG